MLAVSLRDGVVSVATSGKRVVNEVVLDYRYRDHSLVDGAGETMRV